MQYLPWRRQEFSTGGVETLGQILTSMMSLMKRLRKAIHTFVSKERKLHHNYSTGMSPIPQKFIANYSIRGLAVLRAGNRSFVTGSIHGGSRSHLTYTVAYPGFGEKGGGTTGDLGLRPQPPTKFCGFHIKNTHFSALFLSQNGLH